MQRCQPASLRLIDNEQFKMGQFLKERLGVIGAIAEFAKMQYLTKIKGIDIDSMCVAILVFEGAKEDVEFQERKVYDIAVKKFGGILAGRRNGERGYKLTFAIAYVRDFCLSYGILGDSFETSVPWDKTLSLCRNVKYRVVQECKKWGISHFIISCRVTQVYDAGSCVYFYLAFNARDVIKTNTGSSPAKDPFEVFHCIEEKARDEILASGGSLSHHHGIGKVFT
ncbi:hypothetical protein J437_LFUL018155 [Ladona fulva]|uniref:Alkylglycerone-phosphate synthase n=1 Tax=Ladona fulva TaxID=123851 RepID=A0A8K0KPZ3_LADFU|nr:hypothetical protein J437_LFUL018155 [Ladona fulva]